jgi:hypothetical protein
MDTIVNQINHLLCTVASLEGLVLRLEQGDESEQEIAELRDELKAARLRLEELKTKL